MILICSLTGGGKSSSSLGEACKVLLADDAFSIPSPVAAHVLENAKALLEWIEQHKESAKIFEMKVESSLQECVDKAVTTTGKLHSDRIWTAYHSLRTSDVYVCDWECILLKAGVSKPSAISYQYIGDYILKTMIKTTYPTTAREAALSTTKLSYEEINGLRYAAGYVVRSLQKKALKSTHPQKGDVQLCLSQLLQTEDEAEDDSQDWIQLIDRGGLCHVNNDVYELFLVMEKELHKRISFDKLTDMTPELRKELKECDSVQFIWYLISADWDDNSSSHILDSMIAEWVKIRGFSLAGAWVEQYKAANKKTTQKSKGVRKQLLSV